MNFKKRVKQVNEESKLLVQGWIRKRVPYLTIPIQLIFVVILHYFEECKFSKYGLVPELWNFTNHDRTVTNDACYTVYGAKVKMDYSFGSIMPFHGLWKYRIEKCPGGKLGFEVVDLFHGGRIYSMYSNKPFTDLIEGDIVEIYVIIEKDRKQIRFNKISPGIEDKNLFYLACNYQRGRFYTPCVVFYEMEDSVTLISFQTGIPIPV